MNTHELKTLPEYFDAVQKGTKTFEIRKNDRNFKVGDLLYMLRQEENSDVPTNATMMKIVYMTDYEQKEGYVVLGIERVEVD